jgi:nitrate/nitrite-specific signal transduction histidine kinase
MRFAIRRRLQASFAIIALAALGIAFSNYLQYRRIEGDAHAINLAGSQRMRSYRLALLAAEHVAFPGPATEEALETELALFRQVLASIGPGPTPEATSALERGRELFESYELSLRAIVRNANEVARSAGGGPDPELRVATAPLRSS